MTEYISREAALTIEDLRVECGPEEIGLICRGMALYGDHIKGLPVTGLIRCRDCRHYGVGVKVRGPREYCVLNRRALDAGDYCSGAEEREDA